MQSSAWCRLTRQKHLNTPSISLSGKQRGHLGWVGLWGFLTGTEQKRPSDAAVTSHSLFHTRRQENRPPQKPASIDGFAERHERIFTGSVTQPENAGFSRAAWCQLISQHNFFDLKLNFISGVCFILPVCNIGKEKRLFFLFKRH